MAATIRRLAQGLFFGITGSAMTVTTSPRPCRTDDQEAKADFGCRRPTAGPVAYDLRGVVRPKAVNLALQ